MNPYQPPARASEDSPSLDRAGDAIRIRRVTGNCYRALGLFSVGMTVVSIATAYWTDSLHIDFLFIIWFWIGGALKRGHPTARKWAITFFVLVSALSVLGLFLPAAEFRLGAYQFDRAHPAYFGALVVMWLVFAVPGIMLLGPRGRAAFAKKKSAQQDGASDGEKPPN